MKKIIALVLTVLIAASLTAVTGFADDDFVHVLFINRDGILFNGDVGGLFANHSAGYDEVDVEDYVGGTIEISGWCVTDAEIQKYGYTVDGGDFIESDYVNNVEADYTAIRNQMSKFEDAVDAARFWVKVPAMYGDHTIEVYLKIDDDLDLLWTVDTSGGKDPNATEKPTPEATEVPPTEEPTEVPATEVRATEAPTDEPAATDLPATEAADNSGDSSETKNDNKNNTGLIIGIVCGVIVLAAVVAFVILSKKKKK